ncbi:hypothetical protein Lalb_Chr06g0171621 [Lupinus albus]|uniref:Uncharacterized protein n=1 Tax=Lupinus albus TaxID=3870 RepID=A0A6A4QE41_LUPAL|nr:hypothetical protein Lalb_Chr06g0171621 [Lupinus albus]
MFTYKLHIFPLVAVAISLPTVVILGSTTTDNKPIKCLILEEEPHEGHNLGGKY